MKPFGKRIGETPEHMKRTLQAVTTSQHHENGQPEDVTFTLPPGFEHQIDTKFSRVEVWFSSPEQAQGFARLLSDTLKNGGRVILERETK